MKIQSIIAAITALSSSALALPFQITAVSDEPAINGRAVNAANGWFYFNMDTVSYCPPATSCPNAKFTIFKIVDGGLQLSVSNTNPQKVFTYRVNNVGDPSTSGILAFQAPTVTDWYTGVYNGFTLVNDYLQFNGKDFLACPEPAEGPTVYSVYIGDGGKSGVTCVSFQAKITTNQGSPNWEYTAPPY